MHATALVGGTISAVAARVNADGDTSSAGLAWQQSVLRSLRAACAGEHHALDAVEWWLLALGSLLAVAAVGGAARRVAQRLVRRSTPELIVLLDQSAAFYGRWAHDELAGAPRSELQLEADRCRRIVELLERRPAAGARGGAAEHGRIAGLHAWMTLLAKQIDACDNIPTGTAYA